jgi:hypothetical protein
MHLELYPLSQSYVTGGCLLHAKSEVHGMYIYRYILMKNQDRYYGQ